MAATKTVTVNIRIQEDIKTKAEKILATIGISRATAIDMFYRQIILHNGIPFDVAIPATVPSTDTLDESTLDTMLGASYLQSLQGDTYSVDEVFDDHKNSV